MFFNLIAKLVETEATSDSRTLVAPKGTIILMQITLSDGAKKVLAANKVVVHEEWEGEQYIVFTDTEGNVIFDEKEVPRVEKNISFALATVDFS